MLDAWLPAAEELFSVQRASRVWLAEQNSWTLCWYVKQAVRGEDKEQGCHCGGARQVSPSPPSPPSSLPACLPPNSTPTPQPMSILGQNSANLPLSWAQPPPKCPAVTFAPAKGAWGRHSSPNPVWRPVFLASQNSRGILKMDAESQAGVFECAFILEELQLMGLTWAVFDHMPLGDTPPKRAHYLSSYCTSVCVQHLVIVVYWSYSQTAHSLKAYSRHWDCYGFFFAALKR